MRQFDKATPLLLPVWKVTNEQLIGECRSGYKHNRLNAEGRPYGIDFLASKKLLIKKGATDRGLADPLYTRCESSKEVGNQLTLEREPLFGRNWASTITVAGGGIQEVNSLYKQRPPDTGYADNWRVSNKTFRARIGTYGSAGYQDDGHFYLKLNAGHYARMSVRFDSIGSNRVDFKNGEITVNYSVNLGGTRDVGALGTLAVITTAEVLRKTQAV